MESELKGELDKGKFLATQLVRHLLEMKADNCIIPIKVRGKIYEVTVKKPTKPTKFVEDFI